jgi:hypothetical protein
MMNIEVTFVMISTDKFEIKIMSVKQKNPKR